MANFISKIPEFLFQLIFDIDTHGCFSCAYNFVIKKFSSPLTVAIRQLSNPNVRILQKEKNNYVAFSTATFCIRSNERTVYSASVTYNLEQQISVCLHRHTRSVQHVGDKTRHPRCAKVIIYPVMTSMNSEML